MKTLHRSTAGAVVLASILAVLVGSVASAGPNGPRDGDPDRPARVDPRVATAVEQRDTTDLWVVLDERADLSGAAAIEDWDARGEFVVDRLRDTARRSQRGVTGWLNARGVRHEAFWAVNAVLVRDAGSRVVDRLAATAGVAELRATETVQLPPTTPSERAATNAAAVEWGIAATRAPDVWDTHDVRGEHIVVGSVDSGVDHDHPALGSQYRGRQPDGTIVHDHSWYDPSGVCGAVEAPPCDNTGHGTHTIGTMVGDDGAGNGIGMAPGARWIAAKGCEANHCTDAALIASGQWMLAPTAVEGTDPRPDLRPHVVNNSWGSPTATGFYSDVVDAWVAAGIVPVFSAGNDGPGCATHGEPGSLSQAYAVAAHDEAGAIAWFSSRGPSAQDDGIKPDIAAPGVAVRSSVPGGIYTSFDGTSMAAPHVAGAVALVLSSSPAVIGDVPAVRALLDGTAVDTEDLQCGGTAGDNNVWGQGKLDVLAAVEQAPRGPLGTVAGTVTADGAPLASADVRLESEVRTLLASTAPDGTFVVDRVPVGDYTFVASSFGYGTVRRNVTVAEDQTVQTSADLVVVPHHDVAGVVVDDRGEPVPDAELALTDTPLAAVTTDAEGQFLIEDVPEGAYELHVTPNACLSATTAELHVDGPEQPNLVVAQRHDQYGYGCRLLESDWRGGETPLGVTGSAGARWVELPFPFTYYGATHERVVVGANGLVSFAGLTGTQDPSDLFPMPFPIPFDYMPDAAIYPFWDDIVLDANSGVYERTVGTAPERAWVVEWRNVIVGNDGVERRASFEMLLHEDGRITMQYRDLDNPRERGSGATVGIENADGTDGLQYSHRTATLPDDGAITFDLGDHGTLSGVVSDDDDGRGVADATVAASVGSLVRSTTTAADGSWLLQLPPGEATVTITAGNYRPITLPVQVVDGERTPVDVTLASGVASVSQAEVSGDLVVGDQLRTQLEVANDGTAPLTVAAEESGGDRIGSSGEPGELLRSWSAAELVQAPHGIGHADGTIWVSETEGFSARALEYTTDGRTTGRSIDYDWLPDSFHRWVLGDMAHDAARGLMCQAISLSSQPDQEGIHCWNPETGEREAFIPSRGPNHHWDALRPTGLAYSAETDTFWVSDPRRTVLLEVAGLSHPVPGAVVHTCGHDEYPYGLALDERTGVLWLANRTVTDTIRSLDTATCTFRERIDHPAQGYQGAGLALDESGDLWTVGHADGRVYELTSGSPLFVDVPWLTVELADTSLEPGEEAALTVTADATDLQAGEHEAEVWLRTDAGRSPLVRIPVRMTVTDYQVRVAMGGSSYTGTDGEEWAADQRWTPGEWGWEGSSTTRTTRRSIEGTQDDELFASARTGEFSVRLDSLPDGRYEVALGVAEIQRRRPGKRVFDVVANGERIATAVDPAREYGQDTAGWRHAVVDVSGGHLVLEFQPRDGDAILNALRVTRVDDAG